jgi:alpha-beta hydrolase superfamily lysophospholipase
MTATTTAEHSTFTAADGRKMGEYRWDVDQPVAHVVLVHGAGEHLGRYEHVAAGLNAAGFSVSGIDHRAHGRTPMAWLNLPGYQAFLDDTAAYVAAEVRTSTVPVFVLGHSMGGGIALVLAEDGRLPVRGLVVTGPTAKLDDDLAPLLRKVAGLLSRLVPMLGIVGGLDTKISRDPAVQQTYRDDPLVADKVSARLGYSVLSLSERCNASLEQVELPFLAIHGTADEITDPQGSQQLYDRSRSADKTLVLKDGWYHEVLNEPGNAEVLDEIVAWISARATSSHEGVA